jgi:hypothetical protein
MIPMRQGKSNIGSPMAAMLAMQAMIGGGSINPLQMVFPTVGMNLDRGSRLSRSHTKKGPGRVHIQGNGSKKARAKARHAVGC